jgi:serine O-acetyltransferase
MSNIPYPVAVVVGKVSIGNDVMIAPNSFVNIDVSDHSVVCGNPCDIKHKDNATKDYIVL